MEKRKLFDLLAVGAKGGLVAGAVTGCLSLVIYLADDLSLLEGWPKFFFGLLPLVAVPVVLFYQRARLPFFWQNVGILLVAYIVSAMLGTLVNLTIHYGIDPDYKNRIVHYQYQKEIERRAQTERKLKAKITYDITPAELRNENLEMYHWETILLAPFKVLPYLLVFSLLVSGGYKIADSLASQSSRLA
ncbi:MAG: hypothetical protein MUC97_14620 [Bernardetiaceae bacterium]|jgi:hypothetical protein|nr:hypothetical protein [Bernardetiaceae bacterium]